MNDGEAASGSGSEARRGAVPPLAHAPRAGRIAVLRALQLGDMLCAVPALRALRAAFPVAHVTLVGLPWAREFAARFAAYVDDFLEFPGFPGLPERDATAADVVGFLQAAQARRFDLVLQLHGSGAHVNECVQLMGGRHAAGFFRAGDAVPDAARFIPWPGSGTETQRLLALLAHLGVEAQGEALEFPPADADIAELECSGLAPAPGTPFACVHPGARFPSRRWVPERFAEVADELVARGLPVTLTGVSSEAAITARVRAAMRHPATDATGRLSLGALAELLRRATLVVSNDTGISHVSAAVGTPSVVVASGSDVARWAPAEPGRHVVLWHDVPCRPCMHVECPVGHGCATGVAARQVTAAAAALVARERSRARRRTGAGVRPHPGRVVHAG
jgi:ADP-heptose:LPS heptosyltransferase